MSKESISCKPLPLVMCMYHSVSICLHETGCLCLVCFSTSVCVFSGILWFWQMERCFSLRMGLTLQNCYHCCLARSVCVRFCFCGMFFCYPVFITSGQLLAGCLFLVCFPTSVCGFI